jgi:hypothetical protein
MKTKFFLPIFFLSMVFMGCPNANNLKPLTPIVTRPVRGLQYNEPGGVVFRDGQSWQTFWKNYCMVMDDKGNKTSAPEVDFANQMLIGVFAGRKPTAGYSIAIEKILEGPKSIVVEYSEKQPSPESMVAMVITYPCQIVSVPRSEKTIEFKKLKGK